MDDWSVVIICYGKAQPAGSKEAIPTAKGWRVRDANERALKPWKENVAEACAKQYAGPPLSGPLDIEAIFVMPRLRSHFGTGRNEGTLKDSAPLYPSVRPDATKLWRAVEDALIGSLWRDDAQIVNQAVQKRYGDNPRVEIRVRPTAVSCIGDLVLAGEMEVAAPRQPDPPDQLSLLVA